MGHPLTHFSSCWKTFLEQTRAKGAQIGRTKLGLHRYGSSKLIKTVRTIYARYMMLTMGTLSIIYQFICKK